MNVSLTPELEKFVSRQVGTGMYNSASEVMRHALRLLVEREYEREAKIQQLKAGVQEGIDRGGFEEFDMRAFLTQMKERG